MPDPISLITAPVRLGLRLALIPTRVVRRVALGEEPRFEPVPVAARPPAREAPQDQTLTQPW